MAQREDAGAGYEWKRSPPGCGQTREGRFHRVGAEQGPGFTPGGEHGTSLSRGVLVVECVHPDSAADGRRERRPVTSLAWRPAQSQHRASPQHMCFLSPFFQEQNEGPRQWLRTAL